MNATHPGLDTRPTGYQADPQVEGGVSNAFNLRGELVRLTLLHEDKDIEKWAGWFHNAEYQRMLESGPSMLWSPKQIKEWIEKDNANFTLFGIRTLTEDALIGFVDLSGFDWVARHAWVAIGVGDPGYWGRGYGTDAMRMLLRYAFHVLNLNRVNLTVFEYNQRAYQSYIKCGFREEGRGRQVLYRFEKRWDIIHMGILREEWEKTLEPA